MKGRLILNDHRDIPMLIHLWKWKVASTASLYYKYFHNVKSEVAYNRLNRLRKHGFLQVRTDIHGKNPVWMLDKKGFIAIIDFLPELKESGYRSENIRHDLWCSAIHLGEFLIEQPKNVQIITEQQLRRYHIEDLPAWVPNPEAHRPDGYMRMTNGEHKTTIAIELEKSRKTTAQLEKLVDFYSEFKLNFLVLWILEGKGLQRRLSSTIEKAIDKNKVHNMVMLKDYFKQGWQSKVVYGPNADTTIADLIYNKAGINHVQPLYQDTHKLMLNDRLRYRNDRETLVLNQHLKTATE
ncbi:MAG: hypothetical protein H6626_05235 [Pseudobdellovibrionaceae bacterium]|nr:MAG: hypothetical protein H6626_05235 [Pseudobdellovibrionaceae bacterium]